MPDFDLDIKMKIFSDNLILCAKDSWAGVIMLAGFVQTEFIKKGIFVRGALHHGSLFWDNEIVSGKGLVEAYELEASAAIYPRIIASDKFIDRAIKSEPFRARYPKTNDRKTALAKLGLRQDRDYFEFIDYFRALKISMDYVFKHGVPDDIFEDEKERYGYKTKEEMVEKWTAEFKELMEANKEFITENLHKYKGKTSIQNKYFWCKEYHNNFCESNGYKEFVIT